MEERKDDFLQRRKHLASMSDTRLKEYFYELADPINYIIFFYVFFFLLVFYFFIWISTIK